MVRFCSAGCKKLSRVCFFSALQETGKDDVLLVFSLFLGCSLMQGGARSR